LICGSKTDLCGLFWAWLPGVRNSRGWWRYCRGDKKDYFTL